jgi:hypothetical protein
MEFVTIVIPNCNTHLSPLELACKKCVVKRTYHLINSYIQSSGYHYATLICESKVRYLH